MVIQKICPTIAQLHTATYRVVVRIKIEKCVLRLQSKFCANMGHPFRIVYVDTRGLEI